MPPVMVDAFILDAFILDMVILFPMNVEPVRFDTTIVDADNPFP